MRATGFVLLGVAVACSGGTDGRPGASGSVGGGGGGGAASGAAGQGGVSGLAGGPGTAGSNGGGGAASGTSGASNPGGMSAAAGMSGAPNVDGGAAGTTPVAGTSATSGDAGALAAAGEGGMTGEGGAPGEPVGLSWPIDCIPEQTCVSIDYPDVDEDGDAHDCNPPGYVGHQGTDIVITPEAQAAGTAVRAAADGVVVFAYDGKYDECPDGNEPDCQAPASSEPGESSGTTTCTPLGPYCGTGAHGCFWCFAGGNLVVILHEGVPGVFATRYDHLKRNSVLVAPGDAVTRGHKLGEAASSGASTAPHLHFEVWGTGFYELADPWAGACGPNLGPSLWAYDPPWSG